MSDTHMERGDWALAGACLTLSGLGLAAVPFVGTRYGDWPEAIALGIALVPLVYIAIHAMLRMFARIKLLEDRIDALERGRQ